MSSRGLLVALIFFFHLHVACAIIKEELNEGDIHNYACLAM